MNYPNYKPFTEDEKWRIAAGATVVLFFKHDIDQRRKNPIGVDEIIRYLGSSGDCRIEVGAANDPGTYCLWIASSIDYLPRLLDVLEKYVKCPWDGYTKPHATVYPRDGTMEPEFLRRADQQDIEARIRTTLKDQGSLSRVKHLSVSFIELDPGRTRPDPCVNLRHPRS